MTWATLAMPLVTTSRTGQALTTHTGATSAVWTSRQLLVCPLTTVTHQLHTHSDTHTRSTSQQQLTHPSTTAITITIITTITTTA